MGEKPPLQKTYKRKDCCIDITKAPKMLMLQGKHTNSKGF